MASHVTVIGTSLQKIKVAVTPAKYMSDVRDEACEKSKSKSKNYDLKYKNKLVDLSQTFRQTGFPSGATLELIVASTSAGVVSVALQLPDDGGRLVDKVPSNTTLWRILRKFESTEGKNYNFTARGTAGVESGSTGAGRIYYEMPNLNIVGRECLTFGDLQKTLQDFGLNRGTALLKLSFKKTQQPFEEALSEIGEYFKEEEAAEESAKSNTKVTPAAQGNDITDAVARLSSVEPLSSEGKSASVAAPETSDFTSQDSTPNLHLARNTPFPVNPSKQHAPPSSAAEEPVFELNERRIEVYLPPSGDTPMAALAPHNEMDYEPTVGHLQSAQGRLQNSSQNRRLLSDAELERQEEEKAAKLGTVKELKIKVRLADQSLAIATLYTSDTALTLYDLVKSAIVYEDQPFKLVWQDSKGTKTVPRDGGKKLVKDLGFSERMLVNFHWEDGASANARKPPALKPEILKKAKELQVPEVATMDEKQNESGPSVDQGKGKEKESGGTAAGKKLPSWLLKGLSKK